MPPALIRSFLACLAAIALGLPSAFAQSTERVSLSSAGIQGNGGSFSQSLSSNGRFVAFTSDANQLVPGDTNGVWDVFVHDRQTGRTTRVSVDSGGLQGNQRSEDPSISPDGRYVAFTSRAADLVPGDTNGFEDVFVHDRRTGWTTRVSVDAGGIQGNANSAAPFISTDGRFVAFHSYASNLVPGDTNGWADVFVHDRQTGQITRVSMDGGGIQGNGNSYLSSIAADGRMAAYQSDASNLVPGDTNNVSDVFVRDLQTGQMTRVSVDSGRVQGNDASYNPSLSSDSRFVAFSSWADHLVPGDTNSSLDVFVHDQQTGQTTRVSVDSGGLQGNDWSYSPSISSDGRFVTFESAASNLVPGDTNGSNDIFVHDRQTGQTTRVSVDSGGIPGNRSSQYPKISSDGRFVAFSGDSSNLIPGDTNRARDVFVHDRNPIMPTLTAQGSCPGLMTLTLDSASPEGGVAFAIGAAGSFTLTSSVCAGTLLDIANPQLGPVIRASWLGTIERRYQTPPAMCGLTVQALDIRTCKTSNAVVL